jgi:hypothetical protein
LTAFVAAARCARAANEFEETFPPPAFAPALWILTAAAVVIGFPFAILHGFKRLIIESNVCGGSISFTGTLLEFVKDFRVGISGGFWCRLVKKAT